MTDSPVSYILVDPNEQPILDAVLNIRDALLLLKQDKSTYIKSRDVTSLYDRVIEQVHLLNILRTNKDQPLESNRVDRVLDDCFQLISLLFLTIGRNNEVPAVYSMTSTIKRLLEHLVEAAYYSAKDLESIEQTLDRMQETVHHGRETCSPHLLTLLETRIDVCRQLVHELKQSLAGLPPSLVATHEMLVSILRSISAANTRSKFPRVEVEGFQEQLICIQDSIPRETSSGIDGYTIDDGKLVTELLEKCLLWSKIVLDRQGKIDNNFQEVYDSLIEIRNQLERLSLTQAWSLRETDLYNFQRQLDKFDESRVNGNFSDVHGNKADLHAQRTLLYLLRRSYAYIYTLIIGSEPVSEALLPIYNQLQTLRRCLLEVKQSGGVHNSRELYPYTLKLSSIDSMRVDGKFIIGADIPEGQASVNALLQDCVTLQNSLVHPVDTQKKPGQAVQTQ